MRNILLILCFFSFFSCRTEEEALPAFSEGSTESVNQWVLNQMKKYYYWEAQIPQKPNYNLPTQDFLKSILNKEDRFTFIVDTKNPSTYPRTVRALYGFDYAVLKLSNNQVVTVIKLVLRNSPAENVGLKRGMMITKINGTAINVSNAETLAASLATFNTLLLSVGEWQNGTIINEKEITVYYGFTFDQPLISKIFEENGKKTGYLYVHDFNEGMARSFSQKFAEFKAAGIQDLVLDLRYNYGGSVASAAALCAMIPSGVKANQPFIKYIGNKNGGTVLQTFAEQIAFDPSVPSFDALQINALNLNKVYVLTSSNTASASEIVINNLKPYINVIQVGTKTLGKDMAGFSVQDDRNPQKITWQLHPVIYKVYNANGIGDYPNGLSPQLQASEYNSLPLLQLGDPNESLLAVSLSKIFGKFSGKKNISEVDVQKILSESENLGIEVNKIKK